MSAPAAKARSEPVSTTQRTPSSAELHPTDALVGGEPASVAAPALQGVDPTAESRFLRDDADVVEVEVTGNVVKVPSVHMVVDAGVIVCPVGTRGCGTGSGDTRMLRWMYSSGVSGKRLAVSSSASERRSARIVKTDS